MYIYIGSDNVAPVDEVLLSVTCQECGVSYELPVSTWLDISITGYVPCECGNDMKINYPPLEERIY